MITVYQELIPLSNKMYDKQISNDGIFTNPIIMPFALNTTGVENIMETVIYIRNDSQEHYYKDIVVSLMKEDTSKTPENSTGVLLFSGASDVIFSLNAASGDNAIDAEQAFLYSPTATGSINLEDKYKSTYIPVVDDGTVSVKFSYGYDELSYSNWLLRKSALVIPYIGTSGMADTSYIPIRMRLTWKGTPTIFTIRDYFIDVSYSSEVAI